MINKKYSLLYKEREKMSLFIILLNLFFTVTFPIFFPFYIIISVLNKKNIVYIIEELIYDIITNLYYLINKQKKIKKIKSCNNCIYYVKNANSGCCMKKKMVIKQPNKINCKKNYIKLKKAK